MTNTEKIKEVLKQVTDKLMNMPRDELVKLIEEAKEEMDPNFITFLNGQMPQFDSRRYHCLRCNRETWHLERGQKCYCNICEKENLCDHNTETQE